MARHLLFDFMIILEADFQLIFRNWRSRLSFSTLPTACLPGTTISSARLLPYLGNPDLHPLLLGAGGSARTSMLCSYISFSLPDVDLAMSAWVKPWGSPELLPPLLLHLPHHLPNLQHLSWVGELPSLLWRCRYPKHWLQLQLWTRLQLPMEVKIINTILFTKHCVPCRNPGQGLNFLSPVSLVQEEEKEEEASKEAIQQR